MTVPPCFPLEFDLTDKADLQQYCDRLIFDRQQAVANPLHPGFFFDITINSRKPPADSSHYRPLPLFAVQRGHFQLVVKSCIQNEPDRFSQVWVADVKRPNESQESYGLIVLKCFQASLLPHPEPTWSDPISEYEYPRQLASVEDLVYNALEDIQGSVVPYYYGKHKLVMPNGESTRVILLEYIEGETLDELYGRYPSHDPLLNKGLLPKLYDEWLEMAKELYPSALTGMRAIGEHKVIHCNLQAENMMVTSSVPRQIVYIDFKSALLNAPTDVVDDHKNLYCAVALPTGCCPKHREDFELWAKSLGGALKYPKGF